MCETLRNTVSTIIFEVESAFAEGDDACLIKMGETECTVTPANWSEFKSELLDNLRKGLN